MTDLLSSCRNYDNYRQAFNRCTGFKIPILGVHLKDLISVNEAMPDYVEDNKVNVLKLQALYSHINELIQLQQIPSRLDANKDLVHLLTVVLLSVQLFMSRPSIVLCLHVIHWCIKPEHRCKWVCYSMWIVCACVGVMIVYDLWVSGWQTECEWEWLHIAVLLCCPCAVL